MRRVRHRHVALGVVMAAAGAALVVWLLLDALPIRAFNALPVKLELTGDQVHFSAPSYPDGRWQVRLSGFSPTLAPRQTINLKVDFTLAAQGLGEVVPRLKGVEMVLAARRINDQQGRFRSQDGYFYSTYLTPSGIPVEGYQYFIANSHLGGPYKTPLDLRVPVPLKSMALDGDKLSFGAAVRHELSARFPPGLYRVELAFFGKLDRYWRPLHVIPARRSRQTSCDLPYETVFYTKLFLPPIKVGQAKTPRAIWTLFSSPPHNGVAGAVAREDAPHFALSTRVKLPARYTLPCRPDRGRCEYEIRPDLPAVRICRYGNNLLEPDYGRGKARVKIKRPDGVVQDLGWRSFTPPRWPEILDRGGFSLHGGPRYRFEQFGKYEITMAGEMYDRFGTRYEAGGTYEVWVAYPLTFATGIKPGTPLRVGSFYSVAATINPPVPATVKASVRFYPGTHPQDVLAAEYSGKAQRFGYFYPGPTPAPLRFPEPGEYLFEIFATHTDRQGRVFMGHMKNASIVMPPQASLTVRGAPLAAPVPETDVNANTLMGEENDRNNEAQQFPFRSGGMIYFAGNGRYNNFIQPAMSVGEPTGSLRRMLSAHFPPALVRLQDAAGSYEDKYDVFPGPITQIVAYSKGSDSGDHLPLMSTTSAGYSPFEYPELVNRAGYFYLASSRPGFPIFFVVADSTMSENYWFNQYANYEGTVGAGSRGDQPGDVYWSLVSGFYADRQLRRAYYGTYSAGGAALQRGQPFNLSGPALQRPVARVNGEDLWIYGGVGPAPGTMYETGAIKGVGSITVPMVAHDVEIDVTRPDGQVRQCRGRANAVGNYTCPGGPLVLDQAGVYQVRSRFSSGGRQGTCVGAHGGRFRFYVVHKDSPHRVIFDRAMLKPVPARRALVVTGRVAPAVARARGYYSVVAPGIMLDQGRVALQGGRFRLKVNLEELMAQFSNLHDHPQGYRQPQWSRLLELGPDPLVHRLRDTLQLLATGHRKKQLSDTVEVTIFVQGEDAAGRSVTAGGKLVLRGTRVIVPLQFIQARR